MHIDFISDESYLPSVSDAFELAEQGVFLQDLPNNPDESLDYYFPEEM